MTHDTSSPSTIFKAAFQGLNTQTLAELSQVAVRREYPENVLLCHQGARERTFYVVVEGQVAITHRTEGGQDRLLRICGRGEYFGEMALLDDSPRSADCETLTPTTVLEINEEAFDALVSRLPSLAYSLMHRVLSNLRIADQTALEEMAERNAQLHQAYEELKAAQIKLVEKQKMERELEIAAQVQRSLLRESLPEFDDYRFASYLEPARAIGGDLYDVIVLDDEHVGLLLADVADKSVHAALFMAVTRTLFLVESRLSLSPAQVALKVHRDMLEISTTDDVFVTVFYGVLHRPSGKLTYIIAGQERPLLFRPGEGVRPLTGKGRFLGMLEELHLDEYTADLQSGDRLVIFSDGVPDAINFRNERYGVEQVHQLMEREGQREIAELLLLITEDIASWTRGVAPFDDLTLLGVEVK